ncbi:WD40 repeat domain-containing protein [Desulfovibrio sp.]
MLVRRILLFACLLLPLACGARRAEVRPEPVALEPDLAAPSESLPDLLFRARHGQSFDVDQLYDPPPESALGQYVFQLARRPATLYLFDQATAYQATDTSLAAALADGTIRLFGDRPCSGVRLERGPARLLSWLPGSRRLAAADADGNLLIVDTESCRLVRGQTLSGPVAALAVSPSGAWLAAADATGTVWCAGASGAAKAVPLKLPAPCLALGFSQGDGVLLAACSDGSVFLFSPAQDKLLDSFRARGGPYETARFTDGRVEFGLSGGRVESFDLADGKSSGLGRDETGFSLEGGVLTYRTWYNVPQQRLLPGPVRLSADVSRAAAQVRVHEPDGSLRCYAADGGASAPCAEAGDWEPQTLDQDGRFRHKGREYAVADRAFQVEHARLLCRFVPGQGFYLWWIRAERPNSANPLQGHLPIRETLDPGETVRWAPLNPPKELP